jgi:hypothetical protein
MMGSMTPATQKPGAGPGFLYLVEPDGIEARRSRGLSTVNDFMLTIQLSSRAGKDSQT